jgi:hypothetical protein
VPTACTFGDCASFQASACSPLTSTFMRDFLLLWLIIAIQARIQDSTAFADKPWVSSSLQHVRQALHFLRVVACMSLFSAHRDLDNSGTSPAASRFDSFQSRYKPSNTSMAPSSSGDERLPAPAST